MTTQYYTATSIDGFIATEDDSLDWLFELGELENNGFADFISNVGALAMGSATYEWIIRNADRAVRETGSLWPYTQTAWVFTTRELPLIEGADIRFVRGSLHEHHRDMRSAAVGKNVWVVGGGDLAGQFYDAGLLDELILQIAPVTLGKGKPLMPRNVPSSDLRLSGIQQINTRMVELRYDVRKH